MLAATHLIGFAVGGGLTQVSVFASEENGTPTTMPSIMAGDLYIAIGGDDPEEFSLTLITEEPNGRTCRYRLLDGSESGALIEAADAYVIFRGDVPIKSVSVQDLANQETSGNPTLQTITSGSGTAPLIAFGYYIAVLGNVNSDTMNPASDGRIADDTADVEQVLRWKIYNSSPQNVNVDMDDDTASANNTLASFYLQLTG